MKNWIATVLLIIAIVNAIAGLIVCGIAIATESTVENTNTNTNTVITDTIVTQQNTNF